MSKQVTISGTTYTLNQQGDSPPWGEDISDLLQALVDIANNSFGTGDILTTSFNISNNISSAANVTGLLFDTGTIRSAIVQYSIYRTTSINELSECGFMIITYKSVAGTWEVVRYSVGDAELDLTVSNTGQIQYTSSNLAGTSHNCLMKFSAKAFTQI